MLKNKLPNDVVFEKIPDAEVYLVGGAVRDQLLGIVSQDKDWVVVGATPDIMKCAGYKEVGIDFPVFLHPQTNEEYALARTERKSSHGYTGFTVEHKAVSLEEDLQRRDLTINAIAQDKHGKLIDPFKGIDDLNQRIFRHVSPAFNEDPLRVLRAARFSAQLGSFGFSFCPETIERMQQLTNSGELKYLQAERIWQETAKALTSDYPHLFIKTLRASHALKEIFPELDILFGIPQTEKYHPEIDTGIHTLMVMEQSVKLSPKLSVRFAAMTHDFGKGATPKNEWPSHKMHELRSFKLLKKFYQRIPTPKHCQDLANKVAKYHLLPHIAFELRPETILKLFKNLDAYRKPEIYEDFLLSCIADSKGRKGFEDRPTPTIDYLRACFSESKIVNAQTIFNRYEEHKDRPSGKVLGEKIDEQRITIIRTVKEQWNKEKIHE